MLTVDLDPVLVHLGPVNRDEREFGRDKERIARGERHEREQRRKDGGQPGVDGRITSGSNSSTTSSSLPVRALDPVSKARNAVVHGNVPLGRWACAR